MNTILHRASHSTELSLAGGNVPEWIHILPVGTFMGRDGRGPYILDDPAGVIAATIAYYGAADPPVDYDHQLEFVAHNGKPAPASGWVKALEARPDGIWARVEWTAKAAAHIAAREYRYVSPVYYYDKAGRIGRLESVALTNQPNLALKALASTSKESCMELKALASLVGLPPDGVSPEALETRIRALIAERDAATATIAEVGKAVQAATSDPADILKAVHSARQAVTPDPGQYVPMDVYASVTRELSELKTVQAATAAVGLVEDARKAGKVTPGMETWAKTYASSDPEGFKTWASAAPDLRPGEGGASTIPPGSKSGEGLTTLEKAICSACGIAEEAYQKTGVHHG